jgi:beta-glucosidase
MTLDEKIQMVHGASPGKVADGYVPPIRRLGIPDLQLAYGPVGIGSPEPSTAFPASIAVAATWDLELAKEEGVGLGNEAKAKGHDVLLAPALNIDRVPSNGRTFEYYSEDPYLTSRMVVENILGIQSEGIIAAAKHFAVYNQETDRNKVSANVSERALREIYLPGFEAAVKNANVGSIIAAYNKVNGIYCSENERLLKDILKDEWGFEGFVLSDWGATRSTVRAANAGLDLEMPTGEYFGDDLRQAVQNGEVSVSVLDEKVRRILRQMGISGTLDDQKKGEPGATNTPRHQQLARRIAADGIVLLKQGDSTLPLDPQAIDSIAVIGPAANSAIVGGGGSSEVYPPYSVSILDGIQKRAGSKLSVEYAGGHTEDLSPIPSRYFLAQPGDASGKNGLTGEYFDNTRFSGEPAVTRVGEQVSFDLRGRSPAPEINRNGFSVRWTGTFAVPTTGNYTLALTGSGESHLYLDDELVIDNGGEHAARTNSYDMRLEAGRPYRIRIDYHNSEGDASISLEWRTPFGQDPVELARQSDVAIVVATDGSTEGRDRDRLELPGNQNELISAVADANARTVVVLRTGGPVLMPWIEEVPNVLEAWYLGMEEGNAIASVLFGDVNPSGKLPLTFGKRFEDYPANTQEQYPGVDGVADYSEDIFVGYRHFDEQRIEPLFAFGHGLSYTSFDYKTGDTRLNWAPREEVDTGDDSARSSDRTVDVDVEIQNTGSREGAEVIQLYLGFPETDVPMPPKQLKGFAKVFLEPGQTERVTFRLDERALSYWDTGADAWAVQNGVYRIMVGSSSQDIRLWQSFAVSPSGGRLPKQRP